MAVPAVASAATAQHRAPVHRHGLTIHALPRHIVVGDSVTIYGRLTGSDDANQTVTLYHRIFPNKNYTVIGHATTDAEGQFQFQRADGVVNSNRQWFVEGPGDTHSNTITEHVAGEISLTQTAVSGTTRHAVTFTGTVSGGRKGSAIRLQQQIDGGALWRTIATTHLQSNGTYSISNKWRVPGQYNVRIAYGGSPETTAAISDAATVIIQQNQAPYSTISTNAAVVGPSSVSVISGTFDQPNTDSPYPGVEVGLYEYAPGHGADGAPVYTGQEMATSSTGGYSFSVTNTASELYQVRTMNAPTQQATSEVFQAVRDTVTGTSSATSSTVGSTVTFSAAVSPSDVGAAAYLEELGRDGHWQIVGTSSLSSTSQVNFSWTFGYAGNKDFRIRVVGGPSGVGGFSASLPVSVMSAATASLPQIG